MKYTVSVLALGILVLQSCIMNNTEETQETTTTQNEPLDTLPRVTGIGGIFFKGNHPDSLNKWYAEQLGINVSEHGAPFEFRNGNNPDEINYLIWAVHDLSLIHI